MLIIIDNYDSFTYNLVQYFGELGAEVRVFRNDEVDLQTLDQQHPSHMVISPGPCSPNEAGISLQVIRHFAGRVPVLGVCLGHQAIGQAFGGQVVRAHTVMHGKISPVYHSGTGVFSGLNNPLKVARYHSLVIERSTLPEVLEVTAWTCKEDGSEDEIMAVRHRQLDVEGVQFHPESVVTEQGHQLLANFLRRSAAS